MGKNKYALLLLLFPSFLFAQANMEKYIVYFKGKQVDQNVASHFSDRALEKRKRFNIPFDERDYSVNADYLKALTAEYIPVLNQSNWLNAAIVLADDNKIDHVKKRPFVSSVIKIKKTDRSAMASLQKDNVCEDAQSPTYEDAYSNSYAQFHLLNGEYLHQQGFNGENMIIGICDEGFLNANTNPGFADIFSQKRILGTYDYVHGDSDVYVSNDGAHGSYCFSFIGGIKTNSYIGTATKSSFYLFHTENSDGNSERLQEEFNLAIALERCNQLGVDVVSISLGYTTFDVSSENHDTSDMKKNNTPAAMAVNMASSKGILVCVAAGNEGAKPWHYISTPSDADSAFAIASVDMSGTPSAFSGWGLATDPRVKPNVAAVGEGTKFLNTSGAVSTGSGTSFATPSLAGMATCLWEAFPAKTNWEIKTAIEQSASQYLTPDKKIGYGIPDFEKAYQLLSVVSFVSNPALEKEITVYPNPFQNSINVSNQGNAVISNIQLMNNVGQLIYSQSAQKENSIALNELPRGMYLLQISTSNGVLIKKLIKD